MEETEVYKPKRAEWFRRYAQERLWPALGHAAPIIEHVTIPRTGRNSDVALVRCAEGKACAVRRIRSPLEAHKLAQVLRLLEARGLPAPRLRYFNGGLVHYLRHHYAVLAETLVEGVHVGPRVEEEGGQSLEALAATARALARLHTEESPGWGPSKRLRKDCGFDRLMVSKFVYRMATIDRFQTRISMADRKRIMQFVFGFREAWGDGRPFVLVHDKIKSSNVIWQPDGEVCLIDWATMCFGPPGEDITNLLARIGGGEEREATAREAYFAGLPEERRARYAAVERLHRAYYHLSRWASFSRGSQKTRKLGVVTSSLTRSRERMWQVINE